MSRARKCAFLLVPALLLAFAAPAQQASGPPTYQVQGEGIAGYNSSDPAGTRDAALEAAQRDAVERSVGVMIESESTLRNYELVKDEVLSRSKGFIKTYKVTKEGRQGDLYKVVIDAQVVKAAFVKGLGKSVENLYRRVGKPRIMVVIKENRVNKAGVVKKGKRAGSQGVAEKEIRKILIKQGFTFIDPRSAGGVSLVAVALKGEEVARAEAVDAARTSKAEIVILGNATVQDKGVTNNFYIAQADLALDVIRVDNGQVMASEVINGRGLQINENSAAVKAVQNAAQEITTKLMEQVTYLWISAKSEGGRIEIIVKNAKFGDLLVLKRALNTGVGGVKQLQQRSFKKGVALFELQSRKSAEEIAEGLYEMQFKKFDLEIEDISGKTLTVVVQKK